MWDKIGYLVPQRTRIGGESLVAHVRQARIQRIAQAIAQKVEGQHGNHDGKAREEDHLPRLNTLS